MKEKQEEGVQDASTCAAAHQVNLVCNEHLHGVALRGVDLDFAQPHVNVLKGLWSRHIVDLGSRGEQAMSTPAKRRLRRAALGAARRVPLPRMAPCAPR